jgi:uncharacterized protein (DUF302 family)
MQPNGCMTASACLMSAVGSWHSAVHDMSSRVVKRSVSSHSETVASLLASIERRGLVVFARIDHAAAARDAGLELADEQVVLFGSPRAGTPLMLSDRQIGIELPLRILVWRDGTDVLIAYGDPRDLADAYDVTEHRSTLEQMAKLLDELTSEAAS